MNDKDNEVRVSSLVIALIRVVKDTGYDNVAMTEQVVKAVMGVYRKVCPKQAHLIDWICSTPSAYGPVLLALEGYSEVSKRKEEQNMRFYKFWLAFCIERLVGYLITSLFIMAGANGIQQACRREGR